MNSYAYSYDEELFDFESIQEAVDECAPKDTWQQQSTGAG